jgi:hypothetical protein
MDDAAVEAEQVGLRLNGLTSVAGARFGRAHDAALVARCRCGGRGRGDHRGLRERGAPGDAGEQAQRQERRRGAQHPSAPSSVPIARRTRSSPGGVQQ